MTGNKTFDKKPHQLFNDSQINNILTTLYLIFEYVIWKALWCLIRLLNIWIIIFGVDLEIICIGHINVLFNISIKNRTVKLNNKERIILIYSDYLQPWKLPLNVREFREKRASEQRHCQTNIVRRSWTLANVALSVNITHTTVHL